MSSGTLSVERCYLLELTLIMFTHSLMILFIIVNGNLIERLHIFIWALLNIHSIIASSLEQLVQSQQHEPTTLQLVSRAGYIRKIADFKIEIYFNLVDLSKAKHKLLLGVFDN
jgi:hypothetical protein